MAAKESLSLSSFYVEDDPELSAQTRRILTEYSKIPEAELLPHLREARDKAWEVFKYPCIGRWAFLDFSIGDAAKYPEVLSALKQGATLLDLGSGLGQDLRKLVFDGSPRSSLAASDLQEPLFDVGYDIFRDRETLQVPFYPGDFFDANNAGLQDHTFDYIHAGSFFHLWNYQEQAESMVKAVRLLKPKPGSMIFGRQSGATEPYVEKVSTSRSGDMYRHNVASFKELVAEVAQKSKTSLHVTAGVTNTLAAGRQELKHTGGGISWLRFDFEIVIA